MNIMKFLSNNYFTQTCLCDMLIIQYCSIFYLTTVKPQFNGEAKKEQNQMRQLRQQLLTATGKVWRVNLGRDDFFLVVATTCLFSSKYTLRGHHISPPPPWGNTEQFNMSSIGSLCQYIYISICLNYMYKLKFLNHKFQ